MPSRRCWTPAAAWRDWWACTTPSGARRRRGLAPGGPPGAAGWRGAAGRGGIRGGAGGPGMACCRSRQALQTAPPLVDAPPAPPAPPAHTGSGAHTFFLKQGEVQRWGGYLVNLIHYEDAASLCLAGAPGRRKAAARPRCLLVARRSTPPSRHAVLQARDGEGRPLRGRAFLGCDANPITFRCARRLLGTSASPPPSRGMGPRAEATDQQRRRAPAERCHRPLAQLLVAAVRPPARSLPLVQRHDGGLRGQPCLCQRREQRPAPQVSHPRGHLPRPRRRCWPGGQAHALPCSRLARWCCDTPTHPHPPTPCPVHVTAQGRVHGGRGCQQGQAHEQRRDARGAGLVPPPPLVCRLHDSGGAAALPWPGLGWPGLGHGPAAPRPARLGG